MGCDLPSDWKLGQAAGRDAATKAALRSYPRTWAAEQVRLPKITPDHYDRTFALSGKAPLDCPRRRHGDVS